MIIRILAQDTILGKNKDAKNGKSDLKLFAMIFEEGSRWSSLYIRKWVHALSVHSVDDSSHAHARVRA